ncbi:nitrogen permease regulator 2-domain-containing protein [Jimgerdemannia flammicorona]|uniref:Nitrogen permease regulator 2-domain-containing protein n=1 Tax=Jimgerdemannia flammicorona TaxID=994334 RepID=A0A433DJI0_9FUNG|nr:nitrogen permease regulator 2-domain-containing protein [Jimgerdemannia flammicorona]
MNKATTVTWPYPSFAMEFQGFPRLHSIFYSVFHDKNGPIVVCQVPEGSITPLSPIPPTSLTSASTHHPLTPSSPTLPPTAGSQDTNKTLIDFKVISEYIIPKKELCGHLVTISTPSYKVMGFPILIVDIEKYRRNDYMFNLCFVFERDAETSSYEPVVRKMAKLLDGLENLIEQLLEDLNSYCECQIPINVSNTINIKLFPTYPNPPVVHDYQVPVYTVELQQLIDVNWDITMRKGELNVRVVNFSLCYTLSQIIGYINGVNHVKKIAEMADVATHWARKSMEHLVYYGCVIMVDIFQFSNIYAVKPDVMRIMEDGPLQNESLRFLFEILLYLDVRFAILHGTTLREWIDENGVDLIPMDIRRFISFGVIKGFLYRVHKYPILTDTAPESVRKRVPPLLLPFLDGQHHYDEICTKFGHSVREMDEVLGYRKEESKVTGTDATSVPAAGQGEGVVPRIRFIFR